MVILTSIIDPFRIVDAEYPNEIVAAHSQSAVLKFYERLELINAVLSETETPVSRAYKNRLQDRIHSGFPRVPRRGGHTAQIDRIPATKRKDTVRMLSNYCTIRSRVFFVDPRLIIAVRFPFSRLLPRSTTSSRAISMMDKW